MFGESKKTPDTNLQEIEGYGIPCALLYIAREQCWSKFFFSIAEEKVCNKRFHFEDYHLLNALDTDRRVSDTEEIVDPCVG